VRRTIGSFGPRFANQKVVRLDVSIDEILVVYGLDTR
jgi:hypothetical protein